MRRFLLTLMIVGIGGYAVGADDLASVEAKIRANWDAVRTFRADLAVEADIPLAPQPGKDAAAASKLSFSAKGTIEAMKEGGKEKLRLSVNQKLAPPANIEGTVDYTYDGVDLYRTSRMKGQLEQTQKVKYEIFRTITPPGGAPLLDGVKQQMDLALGKTSEMDGKPVWVIDATARKDAKNAPAAKARLYFDLETGALRKVQLMDPQEQTLSTMTYTNLTTNPTFPADRFTPPAAK